MAEYKRFVSYIYQYDEGKKGSNVGFAKIQSRNGTFRAVVNIRGVYLGENEKCSVYGLVRKKDALLGILLDECVVNDNAIETKVSSQAENIAGSKYAFPDLCGIFIDTGRTRVYAAGWDEKPLILSRFTLDDEEELQAAQLSEADFEPEVQMETESESEPAIQIVDIRDAVEHMDEALETLSEAVDELRTESVAAEDEVEEVPSESDVEEEPAEEIVEEEVTAESAEAETELQEQEAAGAVEEIEQSEEEIDKICLSRELSKKLKSITSVAEEWAKVESSDKQLTSDAVDEEEQQIQPVEVQMEKEPSGTDSKWEKLRNTYKNIQPFEDDEISECIQIEPKDISNLQKEEWVLGKNSFLLHGYYNYRYLIMGKVKSGSEPQYILGVPGVYENQERMMAGMFGFPNFKAAKKEEAGQEQFGYWYRIIK